MMILFVVNSGLMNSIMKITFMTKVIWCYGGGCDSSTMVSEGKMNTTLTDYQGRCKRDDNFLQLSKDPPVF